MTYLLLITPQKKKMTNTTIYTLELVSLFYKMFLINNKYHTEMEK